MYKVRRFNQIGSELDKEEKLFSSNDLKEIGKKSKEIVDYVNREHNETMKILSR